MKWQGVAGRVMSHDQSGFLSVWGSQYAISYAIKTQLHSGHHFYKIFQSREGEEPHGSPHPHHIRLQGTRLDTEGTEVRVLQSS